MKNIEKKVDLEFINNYIENTNVRDEETLEISSLKKQQLEKIINIIKESDELSKKFYQKSKCWKHVYWIGGGLSIVLSGLNTMIETITETRQANIILSSIISILLAVITFLNAMKHRFETEDAGDKYLGLSEDLYQKTFLQDDLINLDLQRILEVYSTRMTDFREEFNN